MTDYDYIIVGSGFAGAVLAERIVNKLNKKVLIVEKRNHIGGNCFDYYDKYGVLIHKYGPHIFHTNYKDVWEYLSRFTEWKNFQLEVNCSINGEEVPLPFNLNTLNKLFPKSLAEYYENKLVETFGFNNTVPILKLKENPDKDIRDLANFIYETVYLNYMLKQWGGKPEEIDSSVTERVPVKIGRDNRYFYDRYQGLPSEGYTKIFEKMLSHPNINILLNKNAKEILELDRISGKIFVSGKEFLGKVIFTGQVDELFDYEFEDLPYRSLRFEFETIEKDYYQNASVVSYPNNYDFTRITEYKYLTGQKSYFTTIGREYPQEYNKNIESQNIPYYPIPGAENREKYKKYKEESRKYENLILVGRLAEYMYYNMDNIIKRALDLFEEKILGEN